MPSYVFEFCGKLPGDDIAPDTAITVRDRQGEFVRE